MFLSNRHHQSDWDFTADVPITTSLLLSEIKLDVEVFKKTPIRAHAFSTHAKFFKKLTFFTPWFCTPW